MLIKTPLTLKRVRKSWRMNEAGSAGTDPIKSEKLVNGSNCQSKSTKANIEESNNEK